MKQFWMVWKQGGRAPVVQHDTEESAVNEAERLALANSGQVFVVLEAIHARKNDMMQRIDLRNTDDQLPF